MTRFWPGEIGDAFRELQRYSRVAHRYHAHWTVGCPCCGLPARDTLDLALPPRSRAALRAFIRPLNNRIRRATLPDPSAPPEWPWWQRRISGVYR